MPELRCHPVNELLFVIAQNFVPFVDQAEGGGRFLPFDSVVVSAKKVYAQLTGCLTIHKTKKQK